MPVTTRLLPRSSVLRFSSLSVNGNTPMHISKDLREFVELLNSNAVEYVIVGAAAVAWHGYPRYSADLDILIRPGEPNSVRVISALAQFGFAGLGISESDLTAPGMVVQLGFPPNRIDVLTGITGVAFDEVWKSRVAGDLAGIPVSFIGREDLLRNKESTGRPKDLGDAHELRKRGKIE